MPSLKKKARRIRSGSQLRASKRSVVNGEPIALCKRDKIILARVSRELSDAVATIDQIKNEIADGDCHYYAGNMRLLLRSLRRIGKLPRGVSATLKRAKALETRG